MTKRELIRRISLDLDLEQALVRKIAQRTLDLIVQSVVKDGRIELRNFGVFEVKKRAARKARNPRTNEEVPVPAKCVLSFQPGRNVAKEVAKAHRA